MLVLLAQISALRPLMKSSLPGNVNFDPLHLADKDLTYKRLFDTSRDSADILYDYREAELKHGRFAMLASIAYPVQEFVNPILSDTLNLPNELAFEKLSPSLINGNLPASILILFLGFASALELSKMQTSYDLPGDYGWRFTEEEEGTKAFLELQEGEVWNGRIAMIAVFGYVVQEGLTEIPIL